MRSELFCASISNPCVHFVIHYALHFEDEALSLARRLFAYLDESIDSLALIPIGYDELDLYLNGELIHSYRQSGRAPRVSDVTSALSGVPLQPRSPRA